MDLISLVKMRKEEKALELIGTGTDVCFIDQNGWTVLHYAGSEGLYNVIIKVLQEHNIDVDTTDQDGQTAVHKAVCKRQINAFVALVAFGANINIFDKKGKNALDYAIKNKDAPIIELLCYLGTEIGPQDWIFSAIDISTLAKKDQEFMAFVLKQNERLTALAYDSIMYKLHFMQQEDKLQYFLPLGITYDLDCIQSGFFLYCSKSSPDLTSIFESLNDGEEMFSDVYNVIAWGDRPTSMSLSIEISGCPNVNQKLHVLDESGTVQLNFVTEYKEDESSISTIVSLCVDLRNKTEFVILVKREAEFFDISSDSMNVIPEMDPDSNIEIPEGTFQEKGKLQISISETRYWNHDENDYTEDVLFTNAINISTLNGQQPQKAVNVEMPIHTNVPNNEELIILTSEKDFPEETDWEVANITDKTAYSVKFCISHFSVGLIASSSDINRSKILASKAVKEKRRVHFFAMLRKDKKNNVTIAIECAVINKSKQRRKKWRQKGFVSQEIEYKESDIRSPETFRIAFKGNLETDCLTDIDQFLTFDHNKKKSCRTFLLNFKDDNLNGLVCIERIVQTTTKKEVQQVKIRSGFLSALCPKTIEYVKKQENIKEYHTLFELPINGNIPETIGDVGVDLNDPQCTIPVLRKSSLKDLCKHLTRDECYQIGLNLGISNYKMDDLKGRDNFKDNLFISWRRNRPNKGRVVDLISALKVIGKGELAEIVDDCFLNNTVFDY